VPGLPLLFAAACVVIVSQQMAAAPIESLLGVLIVAAGLPVYVLWVRRAPGARKE